MIDKYATWLQNKNNLHLFLIHLGTSELKTTCTLDEKNRHFSCVNVIFAPAVYPKNKNKFIQSHDAGLYKVNHFFLRVNTSVFGSS